MTNQTRKTTALLAILIAMIAGRSASASDGSAVAATAGASSPRVRPTSPVIAALLGEASERSVTFRRLVQAIDASDGLVYLNQGQCPYSVRACLVTVAVAGENRIIHIVVDVRQAPSNLIASMGHELRHALEVLAEPSVTDNDALYSFYMREGRRQGRVFETRAAIHAGDAVREEVQRSMRALQRR